MAQYLIFTGVFLFVLMAAQIWRNRRRLSALDPYARLALPATQQAPRGHPSHIVDHVPSAGKLFNRPTHPVPGSRAQRDPKNPIRIGGRRHNNTFQPREAKPTIVGRIPDQKNPFPPG